MNVEASPNFWKSGESKFSLTRNRNVLHLDLLHDVGILN